MLEPLAWALLVNAPGFALPVLAFFTLKYARPNRPYGRILMLQAIGFGIWACAATLWTYQTRTGNTGWPSPIDGLALLGYVAFLMSNVLFLKLLHESGLVQGIGQSILGVSAVLVLYSYLMIGIGQIHGTEGVPLLVSLLYRFLDVLVLSLTTVNAVFLLRIRESFIGQFQLTLAVGFVLMALGNAFSIAVLLRTRGLNTYTPDQALIITAFYVSSLLVLITGYVFHLMGVKKRFGGQVADDSAILRDALLGAYENALADLVESLSNLLGRGAAASVRQAAHRLGAGPTAEIEIGNSGLPTRTLSEAEWKELLLAVRDECIAVGGALLNPAFEQIRTRYGQKLAFLEPIRPRATARAPK